MNTHDNSHDRDNPAGNDTADTSSLPDALRWQLRALRRDADPTNDLWPGIAARLPAQALPMPRRATARWLKPVAMAASLALVVGAVGWGLNSNDASTGTAVATGSTATGASSADIKVATYVQREAQGLTTQYQSALDQVQAPVPTELQTTVAELDRDAETIRDALARNPGSVRLLEQLRRTYAHRLALAQRVAYS